MERLQSLGFPAINFGVHSVRSGGATAAAQAGVPNSLFKRHGHWHSKTAKDGYVEDLFPLNGAVWVSAYSLYH